MTEAPHLRRLGQLGWVAGALLTAAGCGPTSFLITPVPAERGVRETVLYREGPWAGDKVAIIDVDGTLTNSRPRGFVGPPGENPVSVFKEKLDAARRDKAVKGVVLRINTPGGSVTASDLMYLETLSFKQRGKKPVVACMLDLGTSGGYYLACAADEIIAHPTTVTGSIGVIMLAPNISETLDRIGAKVHIFKSGPMKDAGSPFRALNAADRELYQGLIDQMYARFLKVVARARPTLAERGALAALADGRVFLAPEALEYGLIDRLGTLSDAISAVKQRAEIADRDVKVIQYGRPLAHRPNVYAKNSTPPGEASAERAALLNIELPPWLRHSTPQMLLHVGAGLVDARVAPCP